MVACSWLSSNGCQFSYQNSNISTGSWWPYTLGPIGSIQPFETQHGEWGPPIPRITDIDWEIYSVWLIISDLMLSIAWHFFVAKALYTVRLRWFSPTFRFSAAYLFGTLRLSVVLYFFRAKPTALYIYLHALSFILHTIVGASALFFNAGPWKNLRPNKFGLYHRHPFNPYVFGPTLVTRIRNLGEHCRWGILQWLVTSVSRARDSWTGWLPWTQFRLMPSTMLDNMESRLPLSFTLRLHQMRDTYNQYSNNTKIDTKARSLSLNLDDTLPELGHPPLRRSRSDTPFEEYEGGTEHAKPLAKPLKKVSNVFPGKHPSSPEPSSPFSELQAAFNPQDVDSLTNGDIPSLSTDESWLFVDQPDVAPDVMLVGPGDFNISVSPTKWNQSLLFWARPSLEYFFSQQEDDHDVLDDMLHDARYTKPNNKLEEDMESNLSAVRGTITLRGDGILLSINPQPPQMRAIVLHGLKSSTDPLSTREAIVELVGRRVKCNAGYKIYYFYAEYREYGMKLNAPQRTTMLWLLSTLNGIKLTSDVDLRAFRCTNSLDEATFLAAAQKSASEYIRVDKSEIDERNPKHGVRRRKKSRKNAQENSPFF